MALSPKVLKYNTEASLLQKIRKARCPPLPDVLKAAPTLTYENHEALGAVADHAEIEKAFPKTYGRARISLQPTTQATYDAPLRIGVVLSGGQAPGGHNVIAGIYDYIKKVSPDSVMVGFCDGPQGIYTGQYCIVDDAMMNNYRNSGGFDMIGSGRHKIEKPELFEASMKNCNELQLNGLVIIGGDDSNTNAAVLAEYFEANGSETKVCGCPKTIDGDLKVDPYIPISFGFDTACRTYSELIGNLGQDTLSSQKYYHFVRLMGRAASNIALECALWTRPNICLISEEVEAKKMTLQQITQQVVDVIVSRAKMGKNYGLVLLPEGLIEFIPEFNALIANINDVLATGVPTTEAAVRPHLQPNNQEVFDYLPDIIKAQLLLDRDPHGNVQVAKIETERLLAQMVQAELAKLAAAGEYSMKFDPQFHSYGYEGRSCLPSVFDSTYCYALGQNVAAMISLGLNGLISSVTNLHRPVSEWQCGGVPITMMCHMEKRHGHMKPVIKKALVELDGEPFKCFLAQRDAWAANDYYRGPGPIQFFPESDNVNLCITLALELLKSDPRMALDNLTAANKLQQNAIMQGSIRHAPIQGAACELLSDLQLQRMKFIPTLCPALAGNTEVLLGPASRCQRSGDLEIMQELFPNTFGMPMANIAAGRTSGLSAKRVGVVFCGRQAPGCHDVVSGLFDSLGADSQLIGFVGGNVGLIAGNHIVLTKELVDSHRGQGGLELLCRSEDRICPSTHAAILSTCRSLELDGLVLIGGARTNTAAAHLAEYFKDAQAGTAVVTVPVDIAASLKNEFIEMTVGFDTATKVKGQITGNNATDGGSAKKYYYFMKLKGDEPSISALEVALKTKPNYVILAEEVITLNMSLSDVVRSIADVVQRRAVFGKNYGTVLIPEGLIDAIPELKNLITEINDAFTAMGSAVKHADPEAVRPHLTLWSKAVLDSLPEFMQVSLCYKRGSNNTIPMSQVETEKMLAQLVDVELKNRKAKGLYKGAFSVVCSFLGYQARGALPSNFDISYAYNLGYAATAILSAGLNGYTAAISNLKAPVADWTVSAIPIVAMLQVDESGKAKVPKAQVDLSSPAYAALAAAKDEWAVADLYENPGPAQFYGPSELTNSVPQMLMHESSEPYLASINEVQARLRRIEEACRPGCSSTVLNVALKNLTALTETVDMLEQGPRRPRASMQVDTFKANIRASF